MCNVNPIQKKRVGEKLVLVQNGNQRMNSIFGKGCLQSSRHPFKNYLMKKFSIIRANSFALLFVVKIWERNIFCNGEKFMFFLFFSETPKIL